MRQFGCALQLHRCGWTGSNLSTTIRHSLPNLQPPLSMLILGLRRQHVVGGARLWCWRSGFRIHGSELGGHKSQATTIGCGLETIGFGLLNGRLVSISA